MITVTKKFNFCYGHRLPGYKGKCERMHGHNSTLEVTVAKRSGGLYPTHGEYEGMVLDFNTLKKVVGPFVEELDHQTLNQILDDNPTAENICHWFWEKISHGLQTEAPMVKLIRVRVYETPDSFATLEED